MSDTQNNDEGSDPISTDEFGNQSAATTTPTDENTEPQPTDGMSPEETNTEENSDPQPTETSSLESEVPPETTTSPSPNFPSTSKAPAPTPRPTGSSITISNEFLTTTMAALSSDAPVPITWQGTTTTLPAYQAERFPHICGVTNALPIPLQNQTEWDKTGCLPGFLCWWAGGPDNTTDVGLVANKSWIPEFCPPPAEAQRARLMGGILDKQMGILEPIMCPEGMYCPEPGNRNITCPKNHYCPRGTVSPKKCFNGAYCPEGSTRNMGFAPLALLIVVDFILITIATFFKIRQRYMRRGGSVGHSKRFRKFAHLPVNGVAKNENGEYQKLTDDTEYHGMEEGSVALESRVPVSVHDPIFPITGPTNRAPTGFEGLAAMGSDFSVNDQLQNPAPPEKTDLHLFVQSLKKCLGANIFGLSFEFQNLKFQPPKAKKPILDDVSGLINAGSLWGVMGASGAGKSTFVNVLMGKTDHTGGVTKVNGIPGNIKKYKKIIGYVPQDDIVLPELTVRENILHSARIRLPSNWTDKEIQSHVDILISCLQLSHVKDSLVGSPGAPVISGGQRKRVSIGMELAAAPMAVFLDEPTSGLDATAAASIMSTLKALTRLGMTIVVIIHQPRQEIFESLDSLVLLGAGRMIYQGPEREMQPHFENLGFNFPQHNNPADTMGDIIAGEGRLYKKNGDATIFPLIEHWHETHQSLTPEYKMDPTFNIAEVSSLETTIKSRGAAFHKQIYFCFMRSCLQQWRMKSSFFFELGVGAMAGFLIGLAYLSAAGNNFQGIFIEPYDQISSAINFISVPQMSLLVGLSIGLTASAPGVKIFGEEKLVFWREAAAGHNRFAYYIGKVLSTGPRMVLACFHFSTLFLLLSTPRIPWMAAFLANMLYFYCIYGLASCISMISRREDGPLLAVMSSLIVGVLSGASPSLENARKWHLAWLWRASPGTWLGEAYFGRNIQPFEGLYQIEMAADKMGYHFHRYGKDLGMLVLIGSVYRVVAFLGLRFMWPSKQR